MSGVWAPPFGPGTGTSQAYGRPPFGHRPDSCSYCVRRLSMPRQHSSKDHLDGGRATPPQDGAWGHGGGRRRGLHDERDNDEAKLERGLDQPTTSARAETLSQNGYGYDPITSVPHFISKTYFFKK